MSFVSKAIPRRDRWKWLLMVMAAVSCALPCSAQQMSIRGKGLALSGIFREIQRQTAYKLIFSPERLADAPPIDLDFQGTDVRQLLNSCFIGLQLEYHIHDKTITISRKVGLDSSIYKPLRVRVEDMSNGQPLDGASISVDSLLRGITHEDGTIQLQVRKRLSTLTISYQGYYPKTTAPLVNDAWQIVSLAPRSSILDEVIIRAYGKTTKRGATGSIGQLKGPEVQFTTDGNVLGLLEGRVPGLAIRQYSGVPGSAYEVLIRGKHSIAQGTAPLLVVDGVPVAANNGYQSTIGSGSAQGPDGASVLNFILPSDVASIEVLKGAAETAIYGSRGANGVLLLTLKTGAKGHTRWDADVNSGVNGVVKTGPLLNTRQYLALRREAVSNDGLPVDSTTVPEAFLWDSTRYTNFKQLVMGHAAVRLNARIGLSGGDTNTVYLLSANYHRETAVFPGPSGDGRLSVYGRLSRQSVNRRLKTEVSALASWEDNQLPVQDYTGTMYLAPNAPSFRNDTGQLVWSHNGIAFQNIPGLGYNTYHADIGSQFVHLQVSYVLLRGLELRSHLGYYRTAANESSQNPIAGGNSIGQSQSVANTGQSVLAEELAEYIHQWGKGRLEALLGVTWQEQQTNYSSLEADGFSSDLLLASGSGAPMVKSMVNRAVYRYEAVIARLNYNWKERYIIGFSDRREGSSRFGPGKQFGNFWAVSPAWIFSEEPCCKGSRWLSFGKLRASLGTTGNDQIGNNGFVQVYNGSVAARGYQGQQGVAPISFANDNLRWEVNYNSEVSLDLGFLCNKVLLSATAYRDWTINQLVSINIASQSGLPGVTVNMPADVVNQGLEFSLQTFNWKSQNFRWVSTINLTIPGNRLARFPGLASSTKATSLAVGHSLDVVKAYHFEGVDPATGIFQFRDVNKDGLFDSRDLLPGGNLDLRYYGGCNQSLIYKRWQLDLFFEFRAQNGVNPMLLLYQDNPPGALATAMLGNGPIQWLNHWRRPGDQAPLQKLTAGGDPAAATAIQRYIGSDARAIDASYVRWKGLSLSWRLPAALLSRCKVHEAQVYLRGENLLTHTHYPVSDPETQNATVLPPTRTLAAGFHVNF